MINVNKHAACGYLIFIKFTHDEAKDKLDFYRGLDYI